MGLKFGVEGQDEQGRVESGEGRRLGLPQQGGGLGGWEAGAAGAASGLRRSGCHHPGEVHHCKQFLRNFIVLSALCFVSSVTLSSVTW